MDFDPEESVATVKACLGGEILPIPAEMVSNLDVASQVFRTNDLWLGLSVEARGHLRRFLPVGFKDDVEIQTYLQERLFNPETNFHFGNPLVKFHGKLQGGWFNPDHPSEYVQLRDNARVLYDHYIRRYYLTLNRRLLVSRRKILEAAALVKDETPVNQNEKVSYKSMQNDIRKRAIKSRANKRCKMLLQEVKKDAAEIGLSSDDEDLRDVPNGAGCDSIGDSTLRNANLKDLQLHQPVEIQDSRDMLEELAILRSENPDHPSLETSGITLPDVLERAGLSQMAEKFIEWTFSSDHLGGVDVVLL